MPHVSVIMPAHDAGPYLAESIDSVLAQTYRDFELVIVDDGSTDATLQIARRYRAAHGDRLVVVEQENRGVAAARNAAFRVARGTLFAFLDSDDTWFPTFLDEHVAVLAADPGAAIVTGNAWNRGGPKDGLPVRPVVDLRPLPSLAEILRDEETVFIMSVFRRQVAERIGGFDESFRTNEDYEFWIRAALAGFSFARHSKPLGRYRRHADSLSADERRMIDGILRVYRKTLPACGTGTVERRILEQQIERFEGEQLEAEVRAALDRGDAPVAAAAIDALRRRRGGFRLALAAEALRRVPRAALWAHGGRKRLREVRRRLATAWTASSGARSPLAAAQDR